MKSRRMIFLRRLRRFMARIKFTDKTNPSYRKKKPKTMHVNPLPRSER